MSGPAVKLMVATALVVTACLGPPSIGTAAAVSDGGASSRVVGRGDILTSIIGWRPNRFRGNSSRRTPVCRWWTLDDDELEWLVAVSGELVRAGEDGLLIDSLMSHLGAGTLPDGDVRAYSCGTRTLEFRLEPSIGPRDPQSFLMRQMITHLPAPEPATSPPMGVAVPVDQPVFFSIPAEGWRPIEGTIAADGIVAQVRARPVSIRVVSGDPVSRTASCDGPGRLFDPLDPASPSTQASRPGVCAVRYPTATADPSADGTASGSTLPPRPSGSDFDRPPAWLGTLTVLWQAEWRTGDGPWRSLGLIPRTRMLARPVSELTTTIETG